MNRGAKVVMWIAVPEFMLVCLIVAGCKKVYRKIKEKVL